MHQVAAPFRGRVEPAALAGEDAAVAGRHYAREAAQRLILGLLEPGLAAGRVDRGKAPSGNADEETPVRMDRQPARGGLEFGDDGARLVTGAGEA